MNETYILELNFETEEGNNRKVTIRQPLQGLTEADILPAMQTIVDHDIFEDKNGVDPYAVVKSARYVRRVVEDVFEA